MDIGFPPLSVVRRVVDNREGAVYLFHKDESGQLVAEGQGREGNDGVTSLPPPRAKAVGTPY